jgi:predicted regulator of Ras-like GTPase activity (Roadblock/LC7/MglB family)
MAEPSIFREILKEVTTDLPGALGAIFVDWEGETVDEHSFIGDTNLRLVGAYWGIAYYQARALFRAKELGSPNEMILLFENQQVLIRRVTDEYLVVLALREGINLGRALHLLTRAEVRLRGEM